MPHKPFSEDDFLRLRSDIDLALFDRREKPPGNLSFPPEEGGDPSIRTVTASEILLVTLSAMARATRKLRESNIAIDMGNNPLEMKFTGTIAGVSTVSGEIQLKLEN
jgi:hypothetical protein